MDRDQLFDAADKLSDAKDLVSFVQSLALNAGSGESYTLQPDQLSGLCLVLGQSINLVVEAESLIRSAEKGVHHV